MEFTPSQQQQWNAIIIDCMQAFDRLCREHHIPYYCIGGTAIGVVRHQGMIPWDDDIDVGIPRPDYDRLLALCQTMNLGNYEMMTPQQEGYPYNFAKFCNKQTTLVEYANVPCMHGIYIDVFPIDGTAPTKEEAVRLVKRYTRWRNKINAALTRHTLKEFFALTLKPGEWGRATVQILSVLLGRERMRKFILRRMNKIISTYDYKDATLIVNYNGFYAAREIFPKAWSNKLIEMPFEGFPVYMMEGYDNYLRNVYNDYMQLPPVEQRVSHHPHAFIDMSQRVIPTLF